MGRVYPQKLQSIIEHFTSLSEAERRDGLIALAEQAPRHEPVPGLAYDLESVRKDTQCSDTVGIHLRRLEAGALELAISHGCKVQTLTRALGVVLCKGLAGATAEQVAALPSDFVERIVGEKLVQLRARTIYYVLDRVREAAAALLAR